ncbi:MAG: DUF3343 domain-containing protein [Oscillospiraceae bacterium]|nr:DUF3343 domain-containing protein [Oscillospiraceae bacterium]
MRQKKLTLVITFDTTTQAMAAEKFCMEQNLPGRIIPVPREITVGCGLSWKAPPEAKEQLTDALRQGGLKWAACHLIEI